MTAMEARSGKPMKGLGNLLEERNFKVRPRYTIIFHNVREKFDLSVNEYTIIDSIKVLSTSNPNFRWCTMNKADIAKFLNLGEATVFRAIRKAVDLGLIERSPVEEGIKDGLRATQKWIQAVDTYEFGRN